jgi:acyl carrier protein
MIIDFQKIHFARQQGGDNTVVYLRPITPRNYFRQDELLKLISDNVDNENKLYAEDNVEQELKKILSAILEVKEEDIDDTSSMENIETWDSLKHLELMQAIEEQFDIVLSIDEVVEMTIFKVIKTTLAARGVAL